MSENNPSSGRRMVSVASVGKPRTQTSFRGWPTRLQHAGEEESHVTVTKDKPLHEQMLSDF